jgi:hypothetical protein
MRSRRLAPLQLLLALLLAGTSSPAGTQQIPSPEEFFGHQMGVDRQLARWDRLVEYYDLLGQSSDRIHVVHMGPSTLGNPFLSVFVSAPENLARLDEYRRMNAILSDPRGHSEAEIENAVENGKVVFVQSYGLHSTEVAASQTAAEVMYELATRDDEEVLEILDNTIAIMIPNFNPDGNMMVTDWYNRWVGTAYEGAGPPTLYHHYIGHDNNRDAFMQNTVESRYGAEIMFREWVPQGYIDHHQMGPYTARIYLPPYAEPIRPDGDPLVWREMAWYGAHMAYKMDEADLPGAITAAIYSGWGHFGFHWITPFHNIAGMLTESASARLATPLYVHPDQLGGSRQFPEYEAQTTFPNPWPGGWWRVRDIVVRQKVASFAPLEIAAKNRRTVLRNAYLKASRQMERGASDETVAFVIPARQHDPLTAVKMVNKLLAQGIEVMEAERELVHEGRVFDAGSYVVSMAQPKRGVIRWLLGRTFYPDNSYTRDDDGNPIRPYDMTTDNISEFMGVRVDALETPLTGGLSVVADSVGVSGVVASGPAGYRIDGRLNDSFKAMNRLFAAGVDLSRVAHDDGDVRAGDFVVPVGADTDVLERVARETGVSFEALAARPEAAFPIEQLRVGMFQRYYGGNMDEGWTRWLLEDFGFPYESIMSERVRDGGLRDDFEVIILPDDAVAMMTGEFPEGGGGGFRGADPSSVPPEFRSGFGSAGVAALEAFVREGGVLVTFGRAGDLPMDRFRLPVRNAVAGLTGDDFWAPGATLRVEVDNSHPLAWGMPEEALATFLQGGQVYETVAGARSGDVERVVTYLDRDILQSGWLLGEDRIANKAAAVSVKHGEGRVVMLGFRAQHRAQTHGTFKLVFNNLVDSGASAPHP